jgi:hypothetical protein
VSGTSDRLHRNSADILVKRFQFSRRFIFEEGSLRISLVIFSSHSSELAVKSR